MVICYDAIKCYLLRFAFFRQKYCRLKMSALHTSETNIQTKFIHLNYPKLCAKGTIKYDSIVL